jgi:diguanylate cyclase (GGDEF)-like protein
VEVENMKSSAQKSRKLCLVLILFVFAAARESTRFQATHDMLTSLWNRGVIVELLLREVHRSRHERNCTAVMMCDIDHFKSVNDSYGHAADDDVLREVSRRLRTSVRSYDMVGRYGGEEFLVVLTKCDPASAVHRAENLRQSIFPQPIHLASSQLTVRISLGLALSTDFPRSDVEELLRYADMALYAAKAAGRNCARVAQPESTEDKKVDLPDLAPDKECSDLSCRSAVRPQPAIPTSFPAFAPSFGASSNWNPALASLSTTPAARTHFQSPKTNRDS